jgi:hypothetical protein
MTDKKDQIPQPIKNRRRRLIIVEKTYPSKNKNRLRRLMIKQNVWDGLAHPVLQF